jgi:hypothetical protein
MQRAVLVLVSQADGRQAIRVGMHCAQIAPDTLGKRFRSGWTGSAERLEDGEAIACQRSRESEGRASRPRIQL